MKKTTFKAIYLLGFMTIFFGCNDKEALVDVSTNKLEDITSQEQFDNEIKSGVSMVFFHASWCTKCAAQRPAVQTVSEEDEFIDIFFAEVEYEDHPDIVESRNIKGFPTIVIYKNDVEEKRFTGKGHSDEEIRKALQDVNK